MEATLTSKPFAAIASLTPIQNFVLQKKKTWQKIKRKINKVLVVFIHKTPFQFIVYKSYWHHLYAKKSNQTSLDFHTTQQHYLAQKPNYSAGIGHQVANWNGGLFFADYFNIPFAHFPFSNPDWENLLGFGETEIQAQPLVDQKYKVVRLPNFDSENLAEIELIKNIISSYKRSKILFSLELDQGYTRQFDTATALHTKFFNSPARKADQLISRKENFNIAIHIRRGDIESLTFWGERGLQNEYYAHILSEVLALINTEKNIEIYLFSQGKPEDYAEISALGKINFCLEMNATDSFVEMVNADLLISSKSSFSYTPALLSNGIKICPKTFWHGYPETTDFILADDNGAFDRYAFLNAMLKPAS